MSIDRTADLEIIAKYAGKTSSTYRYIEQDFRALDQRAEAVEGDLDLSKLEDRARRGEALAAEVNDVLGMAQHGNDAAQGAVATVCLVGERYAHGHMVSVELQLAGEDAPAPKIGDRYYTHPQATPRADALADIPSSLLSVPDWAIAAAYRAAVSRLVPDARMSALAFASEVTVAADHEWHSRLGSQDYISDPLALAQWLRLHYRGEFPTPELRAIYELLVDTRSQP